MPSNARSKAHSWKPESSEGGINSVKEKTSQRRVLLIAPQPFYEPRGTPMNVLQMCRVLTKAGYEVDLATYPIGETREMDGLRVLRALPVPGIDAVPIGFSKRKIVLDVSLALLVLWLLITRRYDVVHAVEESVFLALPFTWFGAHLIYDLDSLISHQLEYSGVVKSKAVLAFIRGCERFALTRSSAAITVCRALTEAAQALNATTPIFQVEDTPLDEALRDPIQERIEALREMHGLRDRRIVIYTGNLESYQGIGLLLEAASLVRERVPEVAIVLVGGEPAQVKAFRQQVSDRGLVGSVVAVGAQPPSSMPEWMALGEVLVSPRSQGENTPLKIYTYMRAERPIVATNLETHTQVLDASCAVLCRPTADDFSDGIARVLEDPETHAEIARAARKRVESEYSFEAFGRKLLAAYESLER